jgi:hypothetical protein
MNIPGTAGPGAGAPAAGGAPDDGTNGQDGGQDPGAMIDQAIDLLNKIKAAIAGEEQNEQGGAGPAAGGPGVAPSGDLRKALGL